MCQGVMLHNVARDRSDERWRGELVTRVTGHQGISGLVGRAGWLVDQEVEGGGEGGTGEGAADGDPAVPPATSLLAFDGKEGVGEAG